jgi:hypothetical protein
MSWRNSHFDMTRYEKEKKKKKHRKYNGSLTMRHQKEKQTRCNAGWRGREMQKRKKNDKCLRASV